MSIREYTYKEWLKINGLEENIEDCWACEGRGIMTNEECVDKCDCPCHEDDPKCDVCNGEGMIDTLYIQFLKRLKKDREKLEKVISEKQTPPSGSVFIPYKPSYIPPTDYTI